MAKLYVNMDAAFLAELADDIQDLIGDQEYARLLQIADNLQRMDEKLMNQNRFDDGPVLTKLNLRDKLGQ